MYTNINKDYQEINLKLVAEVEKRPALYNFKLPDFSRKSVTDRLWQEVADEMDKPGIKVLKFFVALYSCPTTASTRMLM